jgi:RNA polymerase sigma-70 factor (ECF subfamily)
MDETFTDQVRRFYEDYRKELFVYALSLTRNDGAAEDAVHTAFMKILRRGGSPRDLKLYAFRCVRNAAIDEFRSNGRAKQEIRLFKPVENENSSDNGPDQSDVEELLRQLSENERETILLKVYGGLTLKEVARTRGARPGTVASWYRRGIEKLRIRLEENSR